MNENNQTTASPAQSHEATIVNRHSILVKATPDELWQAQKSDYLTGSPFEKHGYNITPLEDDLAGFRGGYRLTLYGADDKVVDDRIIRVTSLDEDQLVFFLAIHYLTDTERNLKVDVSYHVREVGNLSELTITSISTLNIALKSNPPKPLEFQDEVLRLEKEWGEHVQKGLEMVRQLYEKPEPVKE